MGLLNGQQWLEVVLRLQEHGYAVAVVCSTPVVYGFLQNRQRIWFLAVRRVLLQMVNMTEDQFKRRVADLDGLLHKGHRRMSLDSILLCEHDRRICSRRLQLLQQHVEGKLDGATGPSGAPMSGLVSLALKEQRDRGVASQGRQPCTPVP